MKKRLLSLAMALCMVLTLLPATAYAKESAESPELTVMEFLPIGGSLHGNGTTEAPWLLNREVLDNYFKKEALGGISYCLPSGNYRLCENISVDNSIDIGDGSENIEITLDLNGYELSNDTNHYTLLYINSHIIGCTTTLTVLNSGSSERGRISSDFGTVLDVGQNCRFNADDASFCGGVRNQGIINGGIFYNKIENHGGTINGGTFYDSIDGGVINDSAKVTVTFESNCSIGAVVQKILSGQKANPLTIERDNCVFGGWYEKVNGEFKERPFDFANTSITKDITLYAKWECDGHFGGTATCKDKAVCDYCKQLYGEVDLTNHIDENEDGYCEVCGEYIADPSCPCTCHSENGFYQSFWKNIKQFYQALDSSLSDANDFKNIFVSLIKSAMDLVLQLVGLNGHCDCGVRHF